MPALLPPQSFRALGLKPDSMNWVEMYTPMAGPDLSLSVSKGAILGGVGVTEFLNSKEQGRDDAGRGGSMVAGEASITMSCG